MLKQFIFIILLSLAVVVPGFARPQKLFSAAADADVKLIGNLGNYSFVKVSADDDYYVDIVRIDRTTQVATNFASGIWGEWYFDDDYFVFQGTVAIDGETSTGLWAVDAVNPNPRSMGVPCDPMTSIISTARVENNLLCNLEHHELSGHYPKAYPMAILDLTGHQLVWRSPQNANYSSHAGDFALINPEAETQSIFDSATNQRHPLSISGDILGAFQNKCFIAAHSGNSVYVWDRSTNNQTKYCDMFPKIFAFLNDRPVIGVVGSPTQFYAVDGPAPVPLLTQPVNTGDLCDWVIQDQSLAILTQPTTTTFRVWELRAGTPFTLKPIGAEFPALASGSTHLGLAGDNIYLAHGSYITGFTASRCDLDAGVLRPFWQGNSQTPPPYPLANHRFLFHAVDAEHGCEFRVTDMNTTASTTLLVECGPGALDHDNGGILPIGSTLHYAFASRTPASAGRDVWITDGTTAGTHPMNVKAYGLAVLGLLSADPDKVIFAADETAGGVTQRGIYAQSLHNAAESWEKYRD